MCRLQGRRNPGSQNKTARISKGISKGLMSPNSFPATASLCFPYPTEDSSCHFLWPCLKPAPGWTCFISCKAEPAALALLPGPASGSLVFQILILTDCLVQKLLWKWKMWVVKSHRESWNKITSKHCTGTYKVRSTKKEAHTHSVLILARKVNSIPAFTWLTKSLWKRSQNH